MLKITFLLTILTIGLQVVNVFISNTIASGSVEAALLKAEIEKVEEKNEIVKAKLLEYSSFTRVASRAAELGFIDSKSFITVNSPREVAVSSHTTQ